MKRQDLKSVVRQLLESENRTAGIYYIIRAQHKREWGIRINNGRLERVTTAEESGIGAQAFTEEGAVGFASGDALDVEGGLTLLKRAAALAERNAGIGGEVNREIFVAPPLVEDAAETSTFGFGHLSLGHVQEKVMALHRRLLARKPDASWLTSYRQIEDIWCIGRSDGTLVSYVIPRALLLHQGTVRVGERAQNALVQRSGMAGEILLEEEKVAALEKRAIERVELAERVCQAPVLPNGSYPLVIDYGLAKGLAHEAFGHAVESDHIKESVLGQEGKLKIGLQVARPGVHIVDGPLDGDWAYQPYSANGLLRQTVHIVEDGVLVAGLGDVFSAEKAGMPVSGAGRAESYAHVPLPRMTNIRLLLDQAIPLTPSESLMEEIRKLRGVLLEQGELRQSGKHLLLLGYRGGQVNPKTGDFVFQCSAIIDLADQELPIYQPSIFSGKILSALQALRAGVGEGCYDAIGTCGKRGQAVASSGGSHRYILMDQDENVRLGGA